MDLKNLFDIPAGFLVFLGTVGAMTAGMGVWALWMALAA